MTTLYKLADRDGRTRHNTLWIAGHGHRLPRIENPKLCEPGVFHAYRNVNLAFILNPIQGSIINPRVFEVRGKIVVSDWGKVGCFCLTIVRELDIPDWYHSEASRLAVQVRFATLCAERVLCLFESVFPGDDRPRKAIKVAQKYKDNHAYSAAHAAYAAHAAASAAYAAYSAAHAAYAAHADSAAYAAAYAADSAAYAADSAAYAADSAAYAAAHAAYSAAHAAYAAAYAADSAAAYAADSAAAYAAYAAAAEVVDFCQLADQAVQN